MNPDLLTSYVEETRRIWGRTRFIYRTQAIIAHELAEREYKGHELGLIVEPQTTLLRNHTAR